MLGTVQSVQHECCFLAFTDGWGDEPIVTCEPIAQSSKSPRLVVCTTDPPIGLKRTVVLYDRFSEGSWLPLSGKVQVGVLLGDVEPDKEPDVSELELTYWATVFNTREEAEIARARLRPTGSS
jgi:hypothetical protein